MNLLNKLTIKNLKLNRKRTIVTIIGITLSVALITAVATMYSSAIHSLITFETKEKGNFHVAYYNVPIEEVGTFKNNRSIETINLTQNIGYAKIDSKNEYKPYCYIKGFTESSLKNLSVKLVEGRLPQNENEIVIPTHLKTNGRLTLNVGDDITLNVGKRVTNEGYELDQSNPYHPDDEDISIYDADTGEEVDSHYEEKIKESIVDTTNKTYKIVGIIERPASNVESYSAPGYTFITYIDENNLSGNVDLYARYTKDGTKNSYKVTANILGVDEVLFEKYYKGKDISSNEEFDKIAEELDKVKYEIDTNSYLISLETDPIGSRNDGGLIIVVAIVIGIIIFTSVFCIKNSFDISITEKTKQYGMLRSIGATKKQIKKNVFYEASILGVIGIPLGIFLGLLASYILIIISNFYLKGMFTENLKLEFSISFIAIFVAIVLGIATIYFSAFRSAKRAAKVSPIDSIRNSANIKINPKKIKSPKAIKKIFGMGGEISYKNLKRNKKKYRTTVISIVVSVFVFISLYSFMSMAFDEIEIELNIRDYNVQLFAKDFNEDSYRKFIETSKLDNIKNCTISRATHLKHNENYYSKEYIDWLDLESVSEKEHYLVMNTLGKEQYSQYIKSLGLKYDEIKDKVILVDGIITESYDTKENKNVKKYMRVYDLNKGDTISGKLENNTSFNIEIGAVTDKAPFGLKNYASAVLVISDELFDKIATSRNVTIYYKSSNADKLQDDIDEYLKGEDYSLNNSEENVKMMKNLYTLLGIFLYGFIIVITLIGVTNIFNTITTNMELRRQEFAMLKSVGMTTKEFNKMIRLESIFMGLKSLIIGVPIGIGLSYLIYHFLAGSSGMVYKLPVVAILISIIAVFILISIIMKYAINKINKQNTIETIRNENI